MVTLQKGAMNPKKGGHMIDGKKKCENGKKLLSVMCSIFGVFRGLLHGPGGASTL